MPREGSSNVFSPLRERVGTRVLADKGGPPYSRIPFRRVLTPYGREVALQSVLALHWLVATDVFQRASVTVVPVAEHP